MLFQLQLCLRLAPLQVARCIDDVECRGVLWFGVYLINSDDYAKFVYCYVVIFLQQHYLVRKWHSLYELLCYSLCSFVSAVYMSCVVADNWDVGEALDMLGNCLVSLSPDQTF